MAIELLTAAINAPRRGYDPVSGALRGLLIEESRTNTILYSQQFTHAPWGPSYCVLTDNVSNAPDGTLTAATFVEDTTAATNHQLPIQGIETVAAGDQRAASIFVKSYSGARYFQLLANGTAINNSIYLVIDTNTGDTVQTASGTLPQNVLVEDCGSGWYRIGFSITADADGDLTFYIRTASTFAIGAQQYDGDGSSGFYIWAAQLEAGAFVTSYIPTTSAAVTRAADAVSLDASWMRGDRGCLIAEFFPLSLASGPYPRVAALYTTAGHFDIFLDGSSADMVLNPGSALYASIPGVLSAGVLNKIAAAFDHDSLRIAANGSATSGVSNTVGLLGAPTTLYIGRAPTTGEILNGWLKSLRYFPYSPSDADLQALAT